MNSILQSKLILSSCKVKKKLFRSNWSFFYLEDSFCVFGGELSDGAVKIRMILIVI